MSNPERRFYASSVSPESAEIMAKLGFGLLVIMQNEWQKAAADIQSYREIAISVGHKPTPPVILTNVSCAPTRAEASDVANAVLDGADAVMLSGETSVGKYPIETVRTMARIVEAAEEDILAKGLPPLTERSKPRTQGGAVARAAAEMGDFLGAKFLVAFTQSGDTVRRLSRYRSPIPLLAFTPVAATRAQLNLTWGVETFLGPHVESTDAMVQQGMANNHGLPPKFYDYSQDKVVEATEGVTASFIKELVRRAVLRHIDEGGALDESRCALTPGSAEGSLQGSSALSLLALAVAVAFAATAQAQTDRKAHNAEEDRIEAQAKADKAKCDALKANAKDICMAEAKGQEKVAKAELEAANPGGSVKDRLALGIISLVAFTLIYAVLAATLIATVLGTLLALGLERTTRSSAQVCALGASFWVSRPLHPERGLDVMRARDARASARELTPMMLRTRRIDRWQLEIPDT